MNFAGARIITGGGPSASWVAGMHLQGALRWYPFDDLINVGTASVGSSGTLVAPGIRILSGGVTVLNGFKAHERCERRGEKWRNGTTEYWGYPHRLQTFMAQEQAKTGGTVGKSYNGIYMHTFAPQVGAGFWAPPNEPRVGLFATKDETATHRWELLVGVGDGVTAISSTVLTGVVTPSDNGSAGTQPRLHRLEIFYMPNEYITAAIDGIVGAVVTTGLPNVANVPLAAESMAGIGCYSGNDINDQSIATFLSMQLETYLP